MSGPPPPPPLHSTYLPYTAVSAPTSSVMTETQTLPHFPPPPYHEYPPHTRRLPQPIQLPPLTIPQSRPDHQAVPAQTQPLPAIQTAPHGTHRTHQQSRSYSGPAAPLDKLLSPHPYTPPRSDAAYSPRSPPRSAIDSRPPYLPARSINDKYAYEDQQRQQQQHHHHHAEAPYMSPVDPYARQSYAALPSPAPSYAPSYPASNVQYRQGIPPPPASVATSYTSSPYPEQAPAPPQAPSQSQAQPPAPPKVIPAGGHPGPAHDLRDLRYELKVRQQPIAARACGFGERDRRVIDPPPIIQLLVTDPKTGQVDLDELRYSLNVVHCTLWNADGSHEETALVQPDRRTTRRLMGQLVASPSVAKDEHDVEGCFFCFPDLSCRTHGKYRLRFILMRIDPMNLHVGGFSPILTEVLSDVFTVYTAKDFPGMRPSSALTRALKLQGCNIQVKKGNEKALTRKRSAISSEGEDDDGGQDPSKKKRTRKE